MLLPRLLLLTALLGAQAAAAAEDGPKVGEPAPTFTLKTINPQLSKERSFSLARHVGDAPDAPRKAVVLSFAASYCEPCKRELAELAKQHERFEKGQVALAVVVIDTEIQGQEEMRKLVDMLRLPFPVVADRFGVVARRYQAVALPYTVVVDKAGSIQWMTAGFQEKSLNELFTRLGI